MRPALLGGWTLFTVVALGNGLDRFSLDRPSKAGRVPWPFADAALLERGQAALETERYAEAVAAGEAAVLSAPVDPASTALLGAARLGAGDAAGADKAFRVAGQMGWRIPLTQAYWLQQALRIGNYPVAALRLDAMLRQYPTMVENAALLAPFEGTEAGRNALAARLDAKSPWLGTYAGTVAELSPQQMAARAQVLDGLAARGVVAGCDAVAPTISKLADGGAIAAARALWGRHCPEARGGGLVDPGLAHVRMNGARTYFDWDLVGSSDVNLVPVSAGNRWIEATSGASVPRAILRQLVVLAPGSYRLSWDTGGSQGVVASFACKPDLPVPVPSQPGLPSGSTFELGNDCPAHWLIFSLLPGEGSARLGSIRLEPAK